MNKGGYQIVDLSNIIVEYNPPDNAVVMGNFRDIYNDCLNTKKPILLYPPKLIDNSSTITESQYSTNGRFCTYTEQLSGIRFSIHEETDVTHDSVIYIDLYKDRVEFSVEPLV